MLTSVPGVLVKQQKQIQLMVIIIIFFNILDSFNKWCKW